MATYVHSVNKKYAKEIKGNKMFPLPPQMAHCLGCPTNTFIETKPKNVLKLDIKPKVSIRKLI